MNFIVERLTDYSKENGSLSLSQDDYAAKLEARLLQMPSFHSVPFDQPSFEAELKEAFPLTNEAELETRHKLQQKLKESHKVPLVYQTPPLKRPSPYLHAAKANADTVHINGVPFRQRTHASQSGVPHAVSALTHTPALPIKPTLYKK